MKLKKEYLILILLIIILGIYLWKHNSDRINYELPKLDKINTKSISKIVLNKPGKNTTLKNKDGKWYIAKKDFQANPEKIEKILNTITDIELNTLISKSKNYNRYKLDNFQSLTVEAFDGKDDLLRGISIGKRSSTYNNNYIKLRNDPNIYLAKMNLNRNFAISPDELRDKTVLEFSLHKISSLTVENSKQVKVQKVTEESEDSQKEENYWQKESGAKLEKNKVKNLLDELQALECSSFYKKEFKKEMTSPDFKVNLKGDNEHFLKLHVEDKGDKKIYTGTTSYVKYPFELKEYKAKKILDAVNSLLP